MNQYLEILANKEVKDNPGIKSALQAKDDKVTISGQANTKDIVRIFEPQFCDHDQDGTVDEETGICTNCGTSFPAFIKKEDEFPSEEELDEVPESKRQRDPDAFPPL
jgi:hypothetical protein